MPKIYYDADADLALIKRAEGRDTGLWIAGARARAEPARQRRRRPGRAAGVEQVAREGGRRKG